MIDATEAKRLSDKYTERFVKDNLSKLLYEIESAISTSIKDGNYYINYQWNSPSCLLNPVIKALKDLDYKVTILNDPNRLIINW